ncbi:MAG TPA: AAA family ATPase [Streptosporangiaceae bacterium]|nr:AAA family ATPase [Streptosporangiaceae bacterium]
MDGAPDRTDGGGPLVGRHDALRAFGEVLDASNAGSFQFLVLIGEPGAGKTRLLGELTAEAVRRTLTTRFGRAAEFEQELPFGAVVDALDDQVEVSLPGLAERLGTETSELLSTVLPALRAASQGHAPPAAPGPGSDLTSRLRVYRAMRRLLEDLAVPDGLVLILDDVHWADSASVELLDYLVRHPPRGRVLVAIAYRPAQASARLAALLASAPHGREVPVGPLTFAEARELLGPGMNRSRCQALHEASGGNPFYLEALARMDSETQLTAGGPDSGELPADGSELPPDVRTALRLELAGLCETSLLVAQAAAVAADEFEPTLVAVAAEVTEGEARAALNELAARDIVRSASAGRLRFRHPLVRRAAYDCAAAGWRLGAHARIAGHLADIGAPPALRAHHVERSAPFGDQAAVVTLMEAARDAAAQAPATAAHWLEAALKIMPVGDASPGRQLEVLLQVAKLRAVSGQLVEGREAAREALRRLPPGDHARRALAARFCALMERQLDRPHEARAVLLSELRRIPDPQSATAVPLRTRLVAESLMRGDIRAAQAVLDLMPERADAVESAVALAIAALRPLPAFALGRIDDAARFIEAAGQLVATAPDDELADWLDAIAWLCWTETMAGAHASALAHFDRAIAIARTTGQGYIISNLLAGQAQVLTMIGRLDQASSAAEEAAEVARLLGSGHQLVFALAQQCLAASWSGEEQAALRLGEEAVRTGEGNGEWSGAYASYALAVALINAGRRDAGRDAMARACDSSGRMLDRRSLMSACEMMAGLEADSGDPGQARKWADLAAKVVYPGQEATARLARAHALRDAEPQAAAAAAAEAAGFFDSTGLFIDGGRARLCAGLAHAAAGDNRRARAELAAAARIFSERGARSLYAATARQQRKLGVRVPVPGRVSAAGGAGGAHGLTQRELDVVKLVGDGYTNQQIAESLFLSTRTVETHLSHIFAKLGVTTRTAILKAISERP